MTKDEIYATMVFLIIVFILCLMWHQIDMIKECRIQGIIQHLSAIEIQGICK